MSEEGSRIFPTRLKKHLLRVQGGKLYLPVAYRVLWFREECPDWGVETQLIEGGQESGFATVQARIYNQDGRLIASGMKTETRADFPAGWVEKAESGSIGRAIGFAGFGTQFTPDDQDDARHPVDSPNRAAGNGHASEEMWEGPGQCPRCHAPEGKRHGKPCCDTGGPGHASPSPARSNGMGHGLDEAFRTSWASCGLEDTDAARCTGLSWILTKHFRAKDPNYKEFRALPAMMKGLKEDLWRAALDGLPEYVELNRLKANGAAASVAAPPDELEGMASADPFGPDD